MEATNSKYSALSSNNLVLLSVQSIIENPSMLKSPKGLNGNRIVSMNVQCSIMRLLKIIV
jgi:hypothetical protein